MLVSLSTSHKFYPLKTTALIKILGLLLLSSSLPVFIYSVTAVSQVLALFFPFSSPFTNLPAPEVSLSHHSANVPIGVMPQPLVNELLHIEFCWQPPLLLKVMHLGGMSLQFNPQYANLWTELFFMFQH